MFLMANFYQSISSGDYKSFQICLFKAICIVTIASLIKSCNQFTVDCCRVQWRFNLVSFIHSKYIRSNSLPNWELSDTPNFAIGTSNPDNCDQRITQDAAMFTEKLAFLLSKTLAAPGIIIFYTIYLAVEFGTIVPVVCYIYFILATVVTSPLVRSLSVLVSNQDKIEGDFRYLHSKYRMNLEPINLWGGHSDEMRGLNKAFMKAIRNSVLLLKKKFLLAMVTNWFSYAGAVGA